MYFPQAMGPVGGIGARVPSVPRGSQQRSGALVRRSLIKGNAGKELARPDHVLLGAKSVPTSVAMKGPLSGQLSGHKGLGFCFTQPLSLLLGQLFRFENHDKFVECTCEGKGHFVHVVLDHRSSCVFANIEGFIE